MRSTPDIVGRRPGDARVHDESPALRLVAGVLQGHELARTGDAVRKFLDDAKVGRFRVLASLNCLRVEGFDVVESLSHLWILCQ